ncbi:hypothetical protein Scep_002771 [Stephania cephalantha]|uniref:Uncharacterized protein n=1 Tax=Stephania cephalantha TaxID=152367 RepID=A0AAP0LDC3_9MAGN
MEKRERGRERETLDVTSDSVEANDGDARQRWRSEAAMETRGSVEANDGGAQTTEREKESERDFAMRERSDEEEKTKVPKSCQREVDPDLQIIEPLFQGLQGHRLPKQPPRRFCLKMPRRLPRLRLAITVVFLQIEPSPGTDLEGLDVAKECLEDVFKLNQSSIEDRVDPGLLIEFFSFLNEKDQHEHPDHLAGSTDVPGTSTSPRNDRNASASQVENHVEEPHISVLSKDELFGQFFGALDKIQFFKTTTDGNEDQGQLDKATRSFHEAVLKSIMSLVSLLVSQGIEFSLHLWDEAAGTFGEKLLVGPIMELERSGCQTINSVNLAETFKTQGTTATVCHSCVQLLRAAAYTQIQMCAEAISDSLKSIDIDPGYSKAYSRLGLAYYAQGNYHDAINEGFMKALQLDPSSDSIKENIQVAQQKIMEAQREADQNARSTSQNNQEANGQSSGRSANRSAPPSFTSFPFNSSTLPNDFANIFMNMASNAYQGHHPNDSSQNGTDSGRPNEPEIRIGGNINLNLEDMPEELMGTWRSVMGMFSGPQPHQNSGGDSDRGSTPN